MKTYRVQVETGEDGWLIAQVAGVKVPGQRRAGVVTQGRDLDELAFMVRDAIETLTDDRGFVIQLLVPPGVGRDAKAAPAPKRRSRRRAA